MNIEEFKKNFRIHSQFAPTVFQSAIDGKRYAIAIGAKWIEIPAEMTYQDVHDRWIKPEKPKPIEPKIIRKVISRKKEYTVTFTNKWNCTCSTFKTKKKCLHLDEVKKSLEKSKLV